MTIEIEKHFRILGLDKSADMEKLKSTFHTLVKKHHPDKKDSSEHYKLPQIIKSYNFLLNNKMFFTEKKSFVYKDQGLCKTF